MSAVLIDDHPSLTVYVPPSFALAPPICKDCKFYLANENWKFSKCAYVFVGQINLVTGAPKRQEFDYCETLRMHDKNDQLCGVSGRFFEAAP